MFTKIVILKNLHYHDLIVSNFWFITKINAFIKTTFHFIEEHEGLECYFCASDDHNYGDCDAEHGGDIVHCQTEDKNAPHYGHASIFNYYYEGNIKNIIT